MATQMDRRLKLSVSLDTQRQKLIDLLSKQDLDFHDQESVYATHNFHAFPAKFPPQLPAIFINQLTKPGEIVLDPMQGSGTTVLEAYLSGRRGLGFDIDPLSIIITRVKTTQLDPLHVLQVGKIIRQRAAVAIEARSPELLSRLENYWDEGTREFIDNWFNKDTQLEIMALLTEIDRVDNPLMRNFYKTAVSAIIITKTGGVSLALDLAHTRPHRAKLVYSRTGEVLEGGELLYAPPRNLRYVTKTLRSSVEEFDKRVQNNVKGLLRLDSQPFPADILFGNAQNLPLQDETVDLIVTSPPYASNAIDYMRAHKFSLVWLGYPIHALSEKRKDYIGAENITQFQFEHLPIYTTQVVSEITQLDPQKGQVLRRYYSEMTQVLREMHRVLKQGKAAILVVGNSEMRGRDTETQNCLADIGKAIGFEVPAIGVRNLDRDRRMLPAGETIDRKSQIQKRMHEEYVIGFYKPDPGG
jgi:DNA modification methylase